jgi:predicted DNA-binding transcriptional regulator AlpA
MNTTHEFVTVADLAARWGVSPDTARRYTLQPGFPAPLVLSPKTLRWTADEVATWEAERRLQEAPLTPPRAGRRRTARAAVSHLPAPARVA